MGTRVNFLDAWGRNPAHGKIIRHINQFEVLVEDDEQVRYCGQTWRIDTKPPGDLSGMFEDLLG